MANIDRANKAIDNIISALYELKEALAEQQESPIPQVTISDVPPLDLTPPSYKDGGYEPEVIISDGPPESFFNAKPEPAPEAASDICFCENCGMKLRPGAKFCPNCGTPV
jgi:hypothetical protein